MLVRSVFDKREHTPRPRASCSRRWLLPLALALPAILVLSATVRAGILDTSWTEPTTNVDGTLLTDLAAYRVYFNIADTGCSEPPFDEIPAVNPRPPLGSTMSHRLTELFTHRSYFVSVSAVDASGSESACVSAAESAVAQIDFSVSPAATTSFGKVPLNGAVDRTFVVRNTGGGTVSGKVKASGPFSVMSGSTFSLVGVGATRTVTVRFSPTVVAAASASLVFTAKGGHVSRSVTGTGVAVDSAPPKVAVVKPTTAPAFSTTKPSQTLAGTAADDVGVTRVTWKNSAGGSGDASGTSAWTAAGIPLKLGANVITITARDAAGNIAKSLVTVTRTDPTPPKVSITAPAASSTLSGAVTVSASATDNVGVVGVQFKLDGVNLGPEVTAAPYAVMWQTATAVPGSHLLTAVARDASGNRTTAAAVPVTVWSTPE